MGTFIRDYGPVIAVFCAGFAGVCAPLLVPKFPEFLIGRSLERYKLKLLQTQKSEKIAQLFAYMPRIHAGSGLTREDEVKINALILELSLYLPRSLVCELTEHIADRTKWPYYKMCFINIRKHLLGSDDGLTGENIAHFVNVGSPQ